MSPWSSLPYPRWQCFPLVPTPSCHLNQPYPLQRFHAMELAIATSPWASCLNSQLSCELASDASKACTKSHLRGMTADALHRSSYTLGMPRADIHGETAHFSPPSLQFATFLLRKFPNISIIYMQSASEPRISSHELGSRLFENNNLSLHHICAELYA